MDNKLRTYRTQRHSRSLEMEPFESLVMQLSYSHSVVSNYGSILYHFRYKAR